MARATKPFKAKDVDKHLKKLSEWQTNKTKTQIQRTIEVSSFVAALALLAKITVYAEVLQHHPDIELSYGKLKIKITTHEAKGLTKADFELAKKIDEIRLR
jgi:4a-hydroxytetrahydrobiopterin dehydratase